MTHIYIVFFSKYFLGSERVYVFAEFSLEFPQHNDNNYFLFFIYAYVLKEILNRVIHQILTTYITHTSIEHLRISFSVTTTFRFTRTLIYSSGLRTCESNIHFDAKNWWIENNTYLHRTNTKCHQSITIIRYSWWSKRQRKCLKVEFNGAHRRNGLVGNERNYNRHTLSTVCDCAQFQCVKYSYVVTEIKFSLLSSTYLSRFSSNQSSFVCSLNHSSCQITEIECVKRKLLTRAVLELRVSKAFVTDRH